MPRVALPDPDATAALAIALAPLLVPGDVVALDGPLGAGKTAFTRALVEALGGDAAFVASPTFTLLHQYDARLPVVHVDAYRLMGPGDLDGLGFDELRERGIAVVEWSQRVEAALPADRWRLRLEHAAGGGRLAEIEAPPGRDVPRLPGSGAVGRRT